MFRARGFSVVASSLRALKENDPSQFKRISTSENRVSHTHTHTHTNSCVKQDSVFAVQTASELAVHVRVFCITT